MTLEDFIRRAHELGVDGVSLASCFIPRFDAAYLSEVKAMLDEYKLDRVFAWGHLDGLKGGRSEPHGPMPEKLARMFEKAVNSPYLGINSATGNFMRVLDDPVKGMQKLAKHVFATHIKDLKINRQAAVDDWFFFFSTTPVGDGLVDNLKLAQLLKAANYQSRLAVEIDFLDPDCKEDEAKAVAQSVKEPRRIAKPVG